MEKINLAQIASINLDDLKKMAEQSENKLTDIVNIAVSDTEDTIKISLFSDAAKFGYYNIFRINKNRSIAYNKKTSDKLILIMMTETICEKIGLLVQIYGKDNNLSDIIAAAKIDDLPENIVINRSDLLRLKDGTSNFTLSECVPSATKDDVILKIGTGTDQKTLTLKRIPASNMPFSLKCQSDTNRDTSVRLPARHWNVLKKTTPEPEPTPEPTPEKTGKDGKK